MCYIPFESLSSVEFKTPNIVEIFLLVRALERVVCLIPIKNVDFPQIFTCHMTPCSLCSLEVEEMKFPCDNTPTMRLFQHDPAYHTTYFLAEVSVWHDTYVESSIYLSNVIIILLLQNSSPIVKNISAKDHM